MILETAQMLSTAVRSTGLDVGYKSTHANHPCNVWARESKQNFEWLVLHGLALGLEYTKRYGKTHKSVTIIKDLLKYSDRFADKGRTPFANCAANKSLGIDYKHMDNVFLAYQAYLNDRWDTDKKPMYYGKHI